MDFNEDYYSPKFNISNKKAPLSTGRLKSLKEGDILNSPHIFSLAEIKKMLACE